MGRGKKAPNLSLFVERTHQGESEEAKGNSLQWSLSPFTDEEQGPQGMMGFSQSALEIQDKKAGLPSPLPVSCPVL